MSDSFGFSKVHESWLCSSKPWSWTETHEWLKASIWRKPSHEWTIEKLKFFKEPTETCRKVLELLHIWKREMSTQKAIGLVILTFLAFIQLSKQLGGDRSQVILAMYMDYNSISIYDSKIGITFVTIKNLCSWNVKQVLSQSDYSLDISSEFFSYISHLFYLIYSSMWMKLL